MISLRPARAISDEEWQKFAALRAGNDAFSSPFFDPDFARLVSTVRPDVFVITQNDNSNLLAFWPIHKRPGRWARPIGGPYSNWHGPVVKEGRHIDASAMLAGAKIAGLTAHGFLSNTDTKAVGLAAGASNVTDVTGGWEVISSDLKKAHGSFYKQLGRLRRNLARDYGEVKFDYDNNDPEALTQLIALKRRQFKDTAHHDVLAANWSRELLHQLFSGTFPNMRARLSSLTVDDGTLIAGEFNLESPTTLHGWITAIDREYAKYSPGHLLVADIIRSMSQDGPATYDAGPGTERHKTVFANTSIPISQGVIRTNQGRLSPMRLMGSVWTSVEKQQNGRGAEVMKRMRQRSDQIVGSDLGLGRRTIGLLQALRATKR